MGQWDFLVGRQVWGSVTKPHMKVAWLICLDSRLSVTTKISFPSRSGHVCVSSHSLWWHETSLASIHSHLTGHHASPKGLPPDCRPIPEAHVGGTATAWQNIQKCSAEASPPLPDPFFHHGFIHVLNLAAFPVQLFYLSLLGVGRYPAMVFSSMLFPGSVQRLQTLIVACGESCPLEKSRKHI